MSDELLRIENVTKKYGKTVANSDISFSVNAGETAVLLGPNGAGKSTIIKCIAGLLRFSGKILICGEPNKTLPAKRELGYIPELPAVYELLTVEEHLEFIRRAYRVEDDGYGDSLLERLELDDKRKSWAASSPRACSRSSPSAAPWCTARACSSSTSRWSASTRTPSKSSKCSSASCAPRAAPCSSPRT